MTNKKNSDRLHAFVQAVAAGDPQYKAYIDHYSTKKDIKETTARFNSSKLIAKSHVKNLLIKAIEARDNAIIKHSAVEVAKEFTVKMLTVEELDSWHCAVIQGLVMMEETIPIYNWIDLKNKNGIVTKRVRNTSFQTIKRPPNIREKQISVDALYRRKKAYPSPFTPVDPDGSEKVIDYVMLADGSLQPLFPQKTLEAKK